MCVCVLVCTCLFVLVRTCVCVCTAYVCVCACVVCVCVCLCVCVCVCACVACVLKHNHAGRPYARDVLQPGKKTEINKKGFIRTVPVIDSGDLLSIIPIIY